MMVAAALQILKAGKIGIYRETLFLTRLELPRPGCQREFSRGRIDTSGRAENSCTNHAATASRPSDVNSRALRSHM